jgi:hypothetical protein
MRGSLRAEEAMEATGMLAQRFERSAAVERLKRLELFTSGLLPVASCRMAIFNQSGMQAVTVVSLNVLNGAKRLNDWNGPSAWMLRAARLNLHSRMFWDWTMARIESCNGKVVCRSLPLFHFLV